MQKHSKKENLKTRSLIVQAVRNFFTEHGYLEVDTPLRIPAPAPEAHIDAQECGDWYLQTSPELCMKELLSDGFEKIFQICKCFRKAERGKKHLPELTMLEWYATGITYLDLMNECEALLSYIASALSNSAVLEYNNCTIDLSEPWERLTVAEAFQRFSSYTVEEAIKLDKFDEIMGFDIEPKLGRNVPVFLYDYPWQMGALARLSPENPAVAERFELYIAGVELCNAFTELTDHAEQRRRFEDEQKYRASLGKRNYPMPEIFLRALENMPDAAGIALGIDRLVMIFTGASKIDEVVAFTPEDL